jgi:hypothetical protein
MLPDIMALDFFTAAVHTTKNSKCSLERVYGGRIINRGLWNPGLSDLNSHN